MSKDELPPKISAETSKTSLVADVSIIIPPQNEDNFQWDIVDTEKRTITELTDSSNKKSAKVLSATSLASAAELGPADENSEMPHSEEDIWANMEPNQSSKDHLPVDGLSSSRTELIMTEVPANLHNIDLGQYRNLYIMYQERQRVAKIANNYLQTKIMQHLGKRTTGQHMIPISQDAHGNKYEKDLLTLKDLYEIDEQHDRIIKKNIIEIQEKTEQQTKDVKKQFDDQQRMIADFSHSLGDENLSKHIEQFMRRQKSQCDHISKLRINQILLRRAYDKKLANFQALDHLGPGFHIMDYVQLKIDNKNHCDRVEERERELTTIHANYKHTVQQLAHIREKLEFVQRHISDRNEDLEDTSKDYWAVRAQLTYIRNERDTTRKAVRRMCDVLGIAGKPKLIEDMTNSRKEVASLRNELNVIQQEVEETKKKIASLRLNLETKRALINF